jgi:hypothetical protein
VSADTIFVQITAFRDPEYQPTLHSLFNRAAHLENIRVGACLQYDSEADQHCFEKGLPAGAAIDEQYYEARDSGGMCWARQITQSMHKGEKFTIQIDSHMRFAPDWDVKLLEMWKRLKDPKAIISHYAPNYEPGQGRVRDQIAGMAPFTWKLGTLWMTHAPFYPISNLPPKPTTGAIISGHFLFGPSSIIKDVPYDPRIERHGEETSVSVRLWTNGYNIYHPNELILWHRAQQKRPMDRDVIPGYSEKVRIGALRARVLLSGLKCDEHEVIADLDKFGLGDQRTLQQYQNWSGINFAEESFTEKASKGLFGPFDPAVYS